MTTAGLRIDEVIKMNAYREQLMAERNGVKLDKLNGKVKEAREELGNNQDSHNLVAENKQLRFRLESMERDVAALRRQLNAFIDFHNHRDKQEEREEMGTDFKAEEAYLDFLRDQAEQIAI